MADQISSALQLFRLQRHRLPCRVPKIGGCKLNADPADLQFRIAVLRPVITMFAPSFAYAVAMPYPMEPHRPPLKTARPAPVMIAVFPVKLPIKVTLHSFFDKIIYRKIFSVQLFSDPTHT